MPRRCSPFLLILLCSAVSFGGCATSEDRYAFDPHPADVESARPGVDTEPVRTLVSIVGVHRPDDEDAHEGPMLAVRIRLENTSPDPVTFDPASLVLVSGRLVRFPDPVVEPAGIVTVASGESAVLNACFPFPGDGSPEGTDMSGLNLRWTLVIGGVAVTSSTGFVRRLPDWYYSPDRGVGVGYHRYPV